MASRILIDDIPIHEDITEERVLEAAQRQMVDLEDPGFCIGCGFEAGNCEPDARKNPCESCGAPLVYGAQELMFHLVA